MSCNWVVTLQLYTVSCLRKWGACSSRIPFPLWACKRCSSSSRANWLQGDLLADLWSSQESLRKWQEKAVWDGKVQRSINSLDFDPSEAVLAESLQTWNCAFVTTVPEVGVISSWCWSPYLQPRLLASLSSFIICVLKSLNSKDVEWLLWLVADSYKNCSNPLCV